MIHNRTVRLNDPKHFKKYSPILVHSIITYSIVLLMPILICSFYYIHSFNTLKTRNQSNRQLVLENVKEQIDSAFRDYINLETHLQLNEYVSSLVSPNGRIDSNPILDRHYLKKALGALQVSNALIQQIDVYFVQSGYVVTSSSAFRYDLIPYMENTTSLMTCADWDTVLQQLNDTLITCFSDEQKRFIAVAQTIASDIHGDPAAIACIHMDKIALQKRFSNILSGDFPCSFALIRDGNLLLSSDNPILDPNQMPLATLSEYFEQAETGALYEINGLETPTLIVGSTDLLLPHTKLIYFIEKHDYELESSRLLELIIFTIVICLFMGFFAIIYFSRKNYQPVSQIMRLIPNEEVASSSLDEYHLIMKMLTDNQDEIRRQKQQLLNHYLQKLCSGEISVSQLDEPAAQYFSVHFPENNVCVVLLCITSDVSVSDKDELIPFVVQNVFSELLGEHFSYTYFASHDGKISVLINTNLEPKDAQKLIIAHTQALFAFFGQYGHLSARAGISNVLKKDCIPTACVQASTALEYCQLFETTEICAYDKIPKQEKVTSLPLESSEYIINLVCAGNRESISHYFEQLSNELKKNSYSLNDAKSCYYFFYQVIAKLRLACNMRFGFVPESLQVPDESFLKNSLTDALTHICTVCCQTCDEIASHSENEQSSRWGTDICRFIENNYMDANMNLATISEHFRISSSYLSRKFKEQYQKGIVDYIYEVRIEHALSLLLESDLKIADIAQMSGFVDSNAFIRIFKKLKGITPGKYRENHIQT